MKPISSMFQEVKYELLKVLLLNVFLESAIVFLACHLILSIFSMPLLYSGVVAALYFVLRFWLQSRKFNLKRIEERNPDLREMLRTANDNQDNDTLMAHALFHEVLSKMQGVSSGTFIDMSIVVRRIGALFVLSVILVSLAFFNVNIAKFENPLAKPFGQIGDFVRGLGGELPEQEEINLDDDGLYGDARMADLSEEELRLQINPSLSQVDFTNVENPDDLQDNIKDFPGAAEAVRDESYAGGLEDVADRKAAAEYSQQVNK